MQAMNARVTLTSDSADGCTLLLGGAWELAISHAPPGLKIYEQSDCSTYPPARVPLSPVDASGNWKLAGKMSGGFYKTYWIQIPNVYPFTDVLALPGMRWVLIAIVSFVPPEGE